MVPIIELTNIECIQTTMLTDTLTRWVTTEAMKTAITVRARIGTMIDMIGIVIDMIGIVIDTIGTVAIGVQVIARGSATVAPTVAMIACRAVP